jgi:hypothetical protein
LSVRLIRQISVTPVLGESGTLLMAYPISVREMNFTFEAFGLSEHSFSGCEGLAKLSIRGPVEDEARTSGSSEATGVDEHDTVTFGGLGLGAGDAGACEGEAFGTGMGDVVGAGTAGDAVTSEGEGLEATWLVGLALPHADTKVATAIAMPIRSRLMYQQR